MNKTKSKPRRYRTLKVIFGILVTAIAIVAIAYLGLVFLLVKVFEGPNMFSNGCDPQTPQSFASMARVTLPDEFSDFDSYCWGMHGWSAEARFEIDPDDLEPFVASTSIDFTKLSTELPQRVNSSYFRQSKGMMKSFLYGFAESSMDWYEEIVVDTSRPDRWVVYFVVLAG